MNRATGSRPFASSASITKASAARSEGVSGHVSEVVSDNAVFQPASKCGTQETVTIRHPDILATPYAENMRRALLVFGICGIAANAANVSNSVPKGAPTRGDPSSFLAAYYKPSLGGEYVLTLFQIPPAEAVDVSLPRLVNTHLIAFGPDAKSFYVSWGTGVTKVQFPPMRTSAVPGSAGLAVQFVTVSQSGRLFVSAMDGRTRQCGAYELDLETATHRPLRVGDFPECAGAWGPVSPDGTKVLSWGDALGPVSPEGKLRSHAFEHLNLLDLKTGASRSLVSITPGEGTGSWSPDGSWIAASSRGRIVLIDASNPSHRRKLGAAGVDGRLIWSPDSKQLLFAKQEWRCSFPFLFPGDDSESLETVNVETGKTHAIPSAHCQVTSSAVGWINPEAFR